MSELFKGIALFTPGGDVVYCIDPTKQSRWHMDLCTRLQTLLDLPAPPDFLVPCYTATVDRWRDRHTQKIEYIAEAYPWVYHYSPLLNAIFNTPEMEWKLPLGCLDSCDPMAIATYYQQFPQLWENHDWVIRVDHPPPDHTASDPALTTLNPHGYIFRLFVSGHHANTERLLQKVHYFLEKALSQPYTLKVIDILKHPDRAETDQILATPTLLRIWPQPIRRIVGEIEHQEQLLRLLS